MRLQMSRQMNRGDTIVEVLIAIAVVSVVMAGAFTVTQKSVLAVRNSQERGEMLQTLQGQVELVRSIALSDGAVSSGIYSGTPSHFCINPTTRAKAPFNGSSPSWPPLDRYNTACKDIANLYNVAVSYNAISKTFIFYGTWERLGGGTNSMQLSYRVQP